MPERLKSNEITEIAVNADWRAFNSVSDDCITLDCRINLLLTAIEYFENHKENAHRDMSVLHEIVMRFSDEKSCNEQIILLERRLQLRKFKFCLRLILPMNTSLSGVSSAEMTDGTSRTVADFWFNVSTADTMQVYDGEFDEDILALPDVRSFGKMPSLRVAMQLDESGVLKELVADFTASTDTDERATLLKQILYKMTGADAISPTSRGAYINARDLHVLETMLGAKYYGQGVFAA